MPNRLSIFSSRLLASGVAWTAVAVFCIESWCWKTLPSKYFSHEVDILLYDLQTRTYDADTIVLGDSVGRQLSRYLAGQKKCDFIPLATNGAVEMAGQYYILIRYLERNRPPSAVILLKHHVLHGDMKRVTTENYLQRCFTRWYEMLSMTWQSQSPSFGLRMLSYRLAAAKYRLHLQKLIPGLPPPETGGNARQVEERLEVLEKTPPLQQLMKRLFPSDLNSISEYYFIRLLSLCQQRNIRIYYVPCPMTNSTWTRYKCGVAYARLVRRLQELSEDFPVLTYTTEIKDYPNGWFEDGIHISAEKLPVVADDYSRLMTELMRQ